MQSMYEEPDLRSENELADYFVERLDESPEDLMGNSACNYDFSDDNFFQKETELAGPSSIASWEEDHGQ